MGPSERRMPQQFGEADSSETGKIPREAGVESQRSPEGMNLLVLEEKKAILKAILDKAGQGKIEHAE